ncbi:hypothetical protein [Streptomyces sp. NPDC101206]|uniref:hypothetical protein n=1 Tax=Streptomyces sp. NPDC101206 TaxID=3366128 RepID=UPI00380EA28E
MLTARIEVANEALRETGLDAVPCLIDVSPDRAEATVAKGRKHLPAAFDSLFDAV